MVATALLAGMTLVALFIWQFIRPHKNVYDFYAGRGIVAGHYDK